MKFSELKNITQGTWLQFEQDAEITHLITDSRKAIIASGSVFFAIKGEHHDGHRFLADLFKQGIRLFVVDSAEKVSLPAMASVLKVNSVIGALQQLAAAHRMQFNYPIIGITGSNAKTIIKEWLSKALASKMQVAKSPKSYNSQLGVALSVWQLAPHHQVGVFEAGISKMNEMANLEAMIKPNIGIFTNIGSAHDEGFVSKRAKIEEKLKLFRNVEKLVYCADHSEVHQAILTSFHQDQIISWGFSSSATLAIKMLESGSAQTKISLEWKKETLSFRLPFSGQAAVENSLHVLVCLLVMGIEPLEVQLALDALESVSMRLELKNAINSSYLINDSYNNDLAGLEIALDFLSQQKQRSKRTVVLSDILESGLSGEVLYKQVANLLNQKKIDRLIGIGPSIHRYSDLFGVASEFYESTEVFLVSNLHSKFQNELILLKGARVFGFERVAGLLQEKIHGTVLEINLDALTHNLNFYRSKLQAHTKLMVMVKAFAYGSGSYEIANLLQFHKVDYLAVAYTDEGVGLRQNGINLPIMVMNPSAESVDKLIRFNLEPEIYSLEILDSLIAHLTEKQTINIHLKVDTGMKRLGFEMSQLQNLMVKLSANSNINIVSVFTHLAGSDEEVHNDFSRQQVERFDEFYTQLTKALGYQPIRHILNSPGIIRFPEYHYEMVRLGIGLYGLEVNGIESQALQSISTLKTTISQIKKINKGESIGYSRKWVAKRDTISATIAIGYADGFDRGFSNEVGKVMVKDKLVPVIGNVCMDMTMIDVTDLEVKVGDEVVIFGPQLSITELAKSIETIPYEILTNVSERVKRVFYAE